MHQLTLVFNTTRPAMVDHILTASLAHNGHVRWLLTQFRFHWISWTPKPFAPAEKSNNPSSSNLPPNRALFTPSTSTFFHPSPFLHLPQSSDTLLGFTWLSPTKKLSNPLPPNLPPNRVHFAPNVSNKDKPLLFLDNPEKEGILRCRSMRKVR